MNNQIVEIAEIGNPVLREIAKPVENVFDADTQNLFESMCEYLTSNESSIGVAAPQISQSLRSFACHQPPHPKFPDREIVPLTVVINPVIVGASENVVKGYERCISVPGIRGFVPRHESITVQYLTRDNQVQTRECSGLLARLFQHEMDHLDGIVYLDRLETPRDIIREAEYIKLQTN